MKVLILAAHPDDEVLGMGGTITKLTKNRCEVKIVIMATGISARRSANFRNNSSYTVGNDVHIKMEQQIKDLRLDAKNAAKIMGVTDIELMDFPDNEMDRVSNLEITKTIEQIIQKFKPEIVFTHSQYDINVDHRVLYYATLTATRPKVGQKVKEVITFEVPSSTEWFFPSNFSPNIFVDISKELSSKQKALRAYKKEIMKYPHPRSTEAIEAIAKRWGSTSGFNAAEAFCLVRKLGDI